MKLSDLYPAEGARHRKKRIGRGDGSGHGTTSCRGNKGQKSRSGGNVNPRFEGGQLPLVKRMPNKRGFKNIFKVEYSVVNIGDISEIIYEANFSNEITIESYVSLGLLKNPDDKIKILGDGDLNQPITVMAHAFSKNAKSKIEAAGGKAIVISKNNLDPKEKSKDQES